MNRESPKKEITPNVLSGESRETDGQNFEKMENIVQADLEALNLKMERERSPQELKTLHALWDKFNKLPQLKRTAMGAGLAFFLGGCGFSLIDVDIKGGLKFEPYQPPAVRYESLPSYSKGRGYVDSGGGTGTWHGYGIRKDKVVSIWEEQGNRPHKKK